MKILISLEEINKILVVNSYHDVKPHGNHRLKNDTSTQIHLMGL